MKKTWKLGCAVVVLGAVLWGGGTRIILPLIRGEVARAPASEVPSGARHIVFLLHGIGGNKGHFGSMVPALMKALPAADPRYRVDVVPFEYETGRISKNTYLFAKDFAASMDAYFRAHGAPAHGDKISLVMHSQGGLVGTIWLSRSFAGDPEYSPQYAPFVDAFITLGTPYWGAKIASFTDMLKKLAGPLEGIVPMGATELKDMALGSRTSLAFRRMALAEHQNPALQRLKQQVRPLNIGGIARSLDFLGAFALGREQYEDDSAVPLPCSRFDFIYHSTYYKNYEEGQAIPYADFKEARWAPFVVVDALHLTPFVQSEVFPSVVQIPEVCVENSQCEHPTFPMILSHLAGTPASMSDNALRRLTGFILDITLKLPDGLDLEASDIKVDFDLPSNWWPPFKRHDVEIGSLLEFYSKEAVDVEQMPGMVRLYYTGTIAKSYLPAKARWDGVPFSDRKVVMRISGPGLKTRVIETKVRASYTTFIDTNLVAADPKPQPEPTPSITPEPIYQGADQP